MKTFYYEIAGDDSFYYNDKLQATSFAEAAHKVATKLLALSGQTIEQLRIVVISESIQD